MPAPSRPFKTAAYAHLAVVGKALSAPVRLELLELLAQAPRTVEALAAEVHQSVANTSRHLQVLKRAHLVTATREGQHIRYALAGADVGALLAGLQEVATRHLAELERLTRAHVADRDGLEALDRDTLLERLAAGDAVLVDVRPAHEFTAGHLPGARSVPLDTLAAQVSELPRDRTIVAYCRGPFCTFAADAARQLRALALMPGGPTCRSTPFPRSTMPLREHWDTVYGTKSPTGVSWFRPRLDQSLVFIDAAELPPAAHVVDIGGGASTLVDDLLARGFRKPTVVDLSARALEHSQARLGAAASEATWIAGDATSPLLPDTSVDLWHDRAVFHFLTDPAQRQAYVDQVRRCVRPGGHVVIATFATDGPETCSGLPTARYAPEGIAAVLGPDFELVGDAHEVHRTPRESLQAFSYAHLRRRQVQATS